MTDIVDSETRSRMMSGIRGRDTKPEMVVRRHLHAAGLRYRIHVKALPGTPDVVFTKKRIALFIHGCFWHQHAGCKFAYRPKSNTTFWATKLGANVARDLRSSTELGQQGWAVEVVWECEVTRDRLENLVAKISGRPGTANA
jgi:DNA mismatch endonuclease (patch repair protein)